MVARWANHWDLGFTQPADVPRKLDALGRHCDAIGRDPSEITVSAVVRTAQGTRRREPREIAENIEQYARAGCDLALVEAVACDPDDAAPEIERLTRLCASVTAA